MAEYDPATNQFLRVLIPFVAEPLQAGLPETLQLANPVFGGDGFVYLFGGGGAQLDFRRPGQRRPRRRVGNAANYRWWAGAAGGTNQWPADHTAVGVGRVGGATRGAIHVATSAASAAARSSP